MNGTVMIGNIYYGDKGISVMRGTPLGNPYRLQDGYTRNEAIQKFHRLLQLAYHYQGNATQVELLSVEPRFWYWLNPAYQELMRLVKIVRTGEDLVLVCCCLPKPCHATVIKQAIEGILAHG
jgi:hypothetical protein